MSRAAAPLAVALLLWPGAVAPAAGSQESEQLYSRGLVDFHAERYREALALFDRAVAADPSDVAARYYRGVTAGRLEDWQTAEADLRRVIAERPDFEQAPLELGVVLFRAGRFAEAIPWLTEAQKSPASYGQASLFLGLGQLRLDQVEAAAENFERASRTAGLELPAAYYRGVAAYRLGRWREAETEFDAVVARSPGSEMGREATEFLLKLRGTDRALQAYGEVSFQYDSNITLEPSSDAAAADFGFPTRQSDGSAVLRAGAGYAPLRGRTQLLLGYEFYQSLYFNLDQYNLQDHRPSVQVVHRGDLVSFGLGTRYDYFLLGDDSYFQGINALPFVSFREGDVGRTEIFFRYRWREYYKSPFRGLLDANVYSPGFVQRFFLGSLDRYLSLAYRYDASVPIDRGGDAYGYDGNEVSAGLTWAIQALRLESEVIFIYRHEDYYPQSNGRRDDEYLVTVLFDRPIGNYLHLVAAYLGAVNDSTQSPFEYTRHIGSIGVEVRY